MANDLTRRPDGQSGIPQLYRNLGELKEAFEYAQEHGNLLSPVIALDGIPRLHAISLRIVHINPDPRGGDVYAQSGDDGGGDLALTKVALDRIAAAAGISWDFTMSGRLDDRSEPDYCLMRRVGWIQDFDGSRRQIGGERDTDLRDGAPAIKGWTDRQLRKAREYLHPMTESKATNRAIRQALAIRGKYPPEQLAKPFIVPRLVFDLEQVTDPETRRQIELEIAREARGATTMLYPPAAPAVPTAVATQQQQAPPPPPPALAAPVQDAEMGRRKPPPVGTVADDDDNGGLSADDETEPPPPQERKPAKPVDPKASGKFGF